MPHDAHRHDREPAIQVAEHLLARNQDDLGRADTKASALAGGALAAATIAFASGGRIWPETGAGLGLIGLGGLCWVAALAMFLLALLPRTGSRADPAWVNYFGAVRKASSTAELLRYLENATQERLQWLVIQLVDTSTITATKYRCIRAGIAFLAASLMTTIIGFLL
jgi:hypothetical protein